MPGMIQFTRDIGHEIDLLTYQVEAIETMMETQDLHLVKLKEMTEMLRVRLRLVPIKFCKSLEKANGELLLGVVARRVDVLVTSLAADRKERERPFGHSQAHARPGKKPSRKSKRV